MDWDVIPGDLATGSTVVSYDGNVFSNDLLRMGEVSKIIYPKDEGSRTKLFTEYDVFVRHSENGTYHNRIYRNCIVINGFGGLADQSTFTLRPSDSATEKDIKGLGKGSKVILLCINGVINNAIILGGIRDFNDVAEKDFSTKENPGHHYHFVFNGVDLLVNDNGEVVLTQKGPTDIEGKLITDKMEEENTETSVSLLKDGHFEIKAKKEFNLDVSDGKTIITSDGVELGDATDDMMLGTTYRDAESQMLKDLQTGFNNLFNKLTTIGSQLTSAVSAAPGAPVTACVTAGTQLIQAALDLQKMGQTIATFEAKADQYLSGKNRLD